MELFVEDQDDTPEEAPQKKRYPKIRRVPPTAKMKIKKLSKKHRKELEKQIAEKRKMKFSFE